MSKYSIVGKRMPRVDARGKVTGETKFSDDIKLSGMLYGKILRSPHPHARILRIDTSKVRKLPGVKAVVTADDTPKIKLFPGDKLVLQDEKVRFIGDEVAAVAAVDEETAEEAIKLIHVEYEELPPVFDPEEAMKPDAPIIHEGIPRNVAAHFSWEYGNVEEAFREADYVFQDRFRNGVQAHCCLEPHICVARPEPDGSITIWSSTQSPHVLRVGIADALGMPRNKIRVMKVPVGGGFGGKSEMYIAQPIAALLAKKTNRPVKVVLPREEVFVGTRARNPFIIELKTGVKKDGTIIARKVRIILDKGAYQSLGSGIAFNAGFVASSLYRISNVRYDAYGVYTNKPYGGAMRGFGNPQITFAIESQMDIIAEKLGMDPVELRLKNANQQDDVTVMGCKFASCGLSECLEKAAEAIGWKEKKRKKVPNRGIGIACGIHCCGTRGEFGDCDYGTAIVKINEDGTVNVLSGNIDMGQGLETSLAQIAAEEIGVPLEDVRMTMADTDSTPQDLGSWGSRACFISGNAVKMAAADARKQLLEAATVMMKENVEDLEVMNGKIHVKGSPERAIPVSSVAEFSYYGRGKPIIGRGHFDSPSTLPDRSTGCAPPPGPSATYLFAAQAVEVEVDPETLQVKVLNVASAHDCGFAINPMAVEGQIEGGIAMGLGFALTEDLIIMDGRVLNPSFTDYKVFTAADMPKVKPIIVETIDPIGPFGAKGVGEQPMDVTAAAVANAIYDAIAVRIKELPITPEKLLSAR